MPLNLLKKYPELLELLALSQHARDKSLKAVFKRDIEDNLNFKFRTKQIRPLKEEGIPNMTTLFNHLTRTQNEDENGYKVHGRSFEIERSKRLHWVKYHFEEKKLDNMEVFSYEDKVGKRHVIRTYIYDKDKKYVIILEPQRSNLDYYLLTGYYIDKKYGKKQIEKKLKNKLGVVH